MTYDDVCQQLCGSQVQIWRKFVIFVRIVKYLAKPPMGQKVIYFMLFVKLYSTLGLSLMPKYLVCPKLFMNL